MAFSLEKETSGYAYQIAASMSLPEFPDAFPISHRFSSWIERNGLATIRSIQKS